MQLILVEEQLSRTSLNGTRKDIFASSDPVDKTLPHNMYHNNFFIVMSIPMYSKQLVGYGADLYGADLLVACALSRVQLLSSFDDDFDDVPIVQPVCHAQSEALSLQALQSCCNAHINSHQCPHQ